MAISLDGRERIVPVAGEPNDLCLRLHAEGVARCIDNIGGILGTNIQCDLLAFTNTRHRHQIVDQPVHAFRCAVDDLDQALALFLRQGRIQQHQCRHLNIVHGISQVVGYDAQHIVPHSNCTFRRGIKPRILNSQRGVPSDVFSKG